MKSGAFAVLSLVVLSIIGSPVPSQAATYGSTNEYLYSISNDEATIVMYRSASTGDVVIPSTLGGFPVVAIGETAFQSMRMSSVAIPNSVRAIGFAAFDSCGLNSVVIPASVTSIAQYAFIDNQMTSVTFQGNAPITQSMVFNGNPNLIVTILDGASGFGETTWQGFPLNRITPFTYSTENNYVTLTGYLGIAPTALTIPATLEGKPVTSISADAFRDIPLTNVVIPDSVISVGDSAFFGTGISSVTLPANLVSIADSAFSGSIAVANNLSDVTIPASVTSIGNYAFAFNPVLNDVNFLGNAPSTVGGGIFLFSGGGSSLTHANVYEDATGFDTSFDAYQVTRISRPAMSGDATLSGLVTDPVTTLSPTFPALALRYSATVANSVATIKVRPTASESHAVIKVNDVTVVSGQLSDSIALNPGANEIAINSTSQDGNTTLNYVLTVTRASTSLSGNSALSTSTWFENSVLTSSNISTLVPTLSGQVFTASVPYVTNQVRVIPVVDQANATVKVAGNSVTSNERSAWVALTAGVNNISIEVTAENGINKTTYTLRITRALPSNVATLSGLATNVGSLSPAFSSSQTTYTVTGVQNNNAGFKLTPTLSDTKASVKVGQQTVISGTKSLNIELTENVSLTVPVTVIAEDGVTTKTYSVTILRPLPISHDAALTSISISGVVLSGSLASGNLSANVPNERASVVIEVVRSNVYSIVKINNVTVGSNGRSSTIALTEGRNTPIAIVVTAQDGTTKKYYAINIARAAINKPTVRTHAVVTAGPVTVNQTLLLTAPTFNGSPTVTRTVNWYRCVNRVIVSSASLPATAKCSIIPRENRDRYFMTTADRGKYIVVGVLVTNRAGAASTYSASTQKVR